jgi:hypothetical protein
LQIGLELFNTPLRRQLLPAFAAAFASLSSLPLPLLLLLPCQDFPTTRKRT